MQKTSFSCYAVLGTSLTWLCPFWINISRKIIFVWASIFLLESQFPFGFIEDWNLFLSFVSKKLIFNLIFSSCRILYYSLI